MAGRRVIWLFDFKPELAKRNGQLPPPDLVKDYRAAFINPSSTFLGPKFKFSKHGRCGAELSELLPRLAEVVDDLAIVKSMHTDAFNHAPGQSEMCTGSQQFGRPSIGAWTTYGLGRDSQDLPAFVVFSTGSKGPSGGASNWGAGFLPSVHQGVMFRSVGDPVLYLSNPKGVDQQIQSDSLDSIRRLNQKHLDVVGDPEIATRINSFELAYRMQMTAPELMDITKEPQHILTCGAEPGKGTYANACLLLELAERDVRFVQIFHEAWDQHGNSQPTSRRTARTPTSRRRAHQGPQATRNAGGHAGDLGRRIRAHPDGARRQRRRDHHPNCFTMWLAGGGVRPGITIGESDEFGFNATKDKVHVHDLHATILHLLGFDHTKLTYRFQGRDFRLTDVAGEIVEKLLA